MDCLPAPLSPGKILINFLCSLPQSLRPYMLSLFLVSQFFRGSNLCCVFLISLFCCGALLFCIGGLLVFLLCCGGLLPYLLRTGGLRLLRHGGLLPCLFHHGGQLFGSGGLLLYRGGLLLCLLCRGGPQCHLY